jgi:hypothetical protein
LVNFFSGCTGILDLFELLVLSVLILGNKFKISIETVSGEISEDLTLGDGHGVLEVLLLLLLILLI